MKGTHIVIWATVLNKKDTKFAQFLHALQVLHFRVNTGLFDFFFS